MDKIKTIVFWQNILSVHQYDFLYKLSKTCRIVLVVDTEIYEERKKGGWHVPSYPFLELFIAPKIEVIDGLLDRKSSFHIFSGINAYPTAGKAFRKAVKKNVPLAILSESLCWLGIKGKLRHLRGVFRRLKYGKNIKFILAIGVRGMWWFEKVGYPKNKLYDFGYFVDVHRKTPMKPILNKKITFVGRIEENKGIFDLLKAIKPILYKFDSLEIYGGGSDEKRLKKILKKTCYLDKVSYKGVLPNASVIKKIRESSLLVLPSKEGRDGWGVVVNEALLSGTPVIASAYVGSSYLLDGNLMGDVFIPSDIKDLTSKLKKWLTMDINREEIITRANQKISVDVAVNYFREIINYELNNSSLNRPLCPWREN